MAVLIFQFELKAASTDSWFHGKNLLWQSRSIPFIWSRNVRIDVLSMYHTEPSNAGFLEVEVHSDSKFIKFMIMVLIS